MNRIGIQVAALVVLLVLSCSAMASTNRACGYRWGDWQRVDNMEGSSTLFGMAMDARGGKLGIAYAFTTDWGAWHYWSGYSEYAYGAGSGSALSMTVSNEAPFPSSGFAGSWGMFMYGMQFDSAGMARLAAEPYGNPGGPPSILTRTGPHASSTDSDTAAVSYNSDLWGQYSRSFVLDAADNPHCAWVHGTYDPNNGGGTLALEYGWKTAGAWTNIILDSQMTTEAYFPTRTLSLVLDTNGYPHVSYLDTNCYAHHAWQDAGGTHKEQLGPTGSGSWPSSMTAIAMDTNGHPMVAHVICHGDTDFVVEMFNGSTWTTNVVMNRPSVNDFTAHAASRFFDLKVDKNGTPTVVVAYFDFSAGTAATTWIDLYAWNGTIWSGGNIGTFPNSGTGLQNMALAFDGAGRPFVAATLQPQGTSPAGIYLLTTMPPPPAGTIISMK